MKNLHQRDKQRTESKDYENNYTTVGFEIDLLKTTDGSPLQGVSHLVIGRSSAKYGLLGMNYLLETDAGNVLELVTPPYMVERDENGILDKADLQTTMKDLKTGFDGTKDDIKGDGKSNIGDGLKAINSSFDINLNYATVKKMTDEQKEGDGIYGPSHMSTRVNMNSLKPFVEKTKENQIDALKITRGTEFSPQLNIFTSVDSFIALDKATTSRLEKHKFNENDSVDVRTAKTNFIGRLRGLNNLGNEYKSSIDYLEYVLLDLEPRREAIIRQKKAQEEIYKNESTQKINESQFVKDGGDASFVKDIHGVWLKADITRFICKALEYKPDLLKKLGADIQRCNTDYRGEISGNYDEKTSGWAKRVSRLGRRLYREGQKASNNISESHKEQLKDLQKEDKDSWDTTTFSLSDRLLGARHDTLLSEDHVKEADEKLQNITGVPDDWNTKQKLLVEVRNMIVAGYDEKKIEAEFKEKKQQATPQQISDHLIDTKVEALIEAWKESHKKLQ